MHLSISLLSFAVLASNICHALPKNHIRAITSSSDSSLVTTASLRAPLYANSTVSSSQLPSATAPTATQAPVRMTTGNSTSTGPETTDCKFTSSMAGPILTSMGITGMQRYCLCGPSGDVMAGINLAVSGTSTTSYCAMGEPVPTGFSQIPDNPDGSPASAYLAAQASASAAAAKCSDGSFVDASCFNELDLPDYLISWWSTNQGQCSGRGFAECFYAKATKYAPSDCGQLNHDAACTQPIWNDFKGLTNGIQNFYVAWNLWNTNGFFLDLYTAIGDAEESAQSSLGAVIALLDPPQQQNIILNDVLDALTFGLSLYSEGSVLVKALLRSAPQTAGLLGKLFPSGTVDGQYQDWTAMSKDLGKATDAFRTSVAQGLPLVQNDVNTFIKWSQNSGLSGERPGLDGLVGSMTQALNTYAIANIISSQGIVVTRAANTDVYALQNNGSRLNWDTGCGSGYDSNGVCSTFFFDGTDTYALTDPSHQTRSFHGEMTSFFTPGGNNAPSMTTGKLLFTGAQACQTATGKVGGADPSLNPTDPTQVQCLSNFGVCTWSQSKFGPFDNCPNNLWRLGIYGCIGEEDNSVDVPIQYLGPGVYVNGNNVPDWETNVCDNSDS